MSKRPRLLLTGASGTIGRALIEALALDYDVSGWSFSRASAGLQQVDLRDASAAAAAFWRVDPDFVVHTAAVSAPDEAERDPAGTRRLNVEATAELARLCRARGARLIHFSTDIVFDGTRGRYRETDATNPTNVYARSKLEAEHALLEACPGALALRVALVYGWARGGRPTFLDYVHNRLSRGIAVTAFTDQVRTPTPVAGIVEAVKRLLPRHDIAGVLHCTGPDRVSRLDFVRTFARIFGYPGTLVVPGTMADVPTPAPRPRDCSLLCDRMAELIGLRMARVEDAMMQLRNDCQRPLHS